MMIVDTHCHVGIHKYEPVESLLHHMDRSKVERGVLIQYLGNADNAYIVECIKDYPGRFSGVMIVEPDDDGTRMRHWAERGLGGIRLRANSRAQAEDPLAQWRTAAELDLVVSTFSTPEIVLSAEFAKVLVTFPTLRIVLEHLGGVYQGAGSDVGDFKRVFALAAYKNLFMKLPGFGEFCELPCPFSEVPPLARMAVEVFGPQRIMWGSDYPPVSGREGYANSLEFPRHYFSDLSASALEQVFGGTALTVWKF